MALYQHKPLEIEAIQYRVDSIGTYNKEDFKAVKDITFWQSYEDGNIVLKYEDVFGIVTLHNGDYLILDPAIVSPMQKEAFEFKYKRVI